jgi:gliding motility-associated-like protein
MVPVVFAQNLVPNNSVEFNASCPSGPGQISTVNAWFDLASHTGTPDYFHSCATSANVLVPGNLYGNELAASGNAYIGLFLTEFTIPDYREYVEFQISSPMVAGQIYAISFAYSLADNSNYSTAAFGMHFSPTAHIGAGTNTAVALTPQISSQVTLANKNGWTVVTQNYIAAGGEQYVLVGNFLDDASTTVTPLGNFGIDGSYVFLDDFVIENVCNYSLGNDTIICQGQSILLDVNAPNATYLWQDNSTNATFTVTQPGTYWVDIFDDCGVTTDTIVLSATQPLVLNFGNDTTLCVGETWLLDATNPSSTYTWQNNSTDSVFNVMQQGIYWVEVSNGCETIYDTVLVSYLFALNVNLGNDIELCQGNILTLNANSPISTYQWQDNSTNPTYIVTQPGIYYVNVYSRCDTAYDSINITYFDPQSPIIGNDAVICQGDSVVLDATSPNATYLWQNNSTDSIFTVTQEGTYWVDIISACGTASDTVEVSYLQSLNIGLGDDTVICEGAQLILEIPFSNLNYLWQDNSSSSMFMVSEPGLYYVTAGVPGCSVQDSINVSYQAIEASFDYELAVSGCPRVNTVSFTDQTNVNFGFIDAYQWRLDDGVTSINPSPVYSYPTHGTYDVTLFVKSNFGCTANFDGNVFIAYYDEIEANFDVSPNKGVATETLFSFSNYSSNATSWTWDFGDGNVSTDENPAHSFADVGSYTVTLVAENDVDCSDTISRTIVINEQLKVFVPNAFTPGNGGTNETWFFSILGVDIYEFSIIVYNRWGEVVWESHDPSVSWNGNYNGELVPPGTYVWRMEIKNPNSSKTDTFYGSVSVIR